MRRRPSLPAAIVALVLAGGSAAAALMVGVRWWTPVPLAGPIADAGWVGRTRAWFTPQGFYPPESDAAGRSFSWTRGHASIAVAEIDRSRPYRVGFQLSAGRGPGVAPPPQMVVSVDGVPRLRADTTNEPRTYVVDVPPASGHTLTVAIDLANTFTPGPNDRRTLGVTIDDVTIAPASGAFSPTRRVVLIATLAAMCLTLAALLCGFGAGWALAAGVVAGAAHAWLLAFDAAFLGAFPGYLMRVSAGAALLGLLVGAIRWWKPAAAGTRDWGLAAGLVLVPSAVKLAFFGHARVLIGDAIFQIHRAQQVHAGHYFFTSITPRPFLEFPYAIALYVNAMPFWSWFPADRGQVWLLRALSLSADALVGLAIYFALRAAWTNRWAPLLFAGLWPFARAPLATLCTSNLTNLYGQGVFGVALGLAGWMAARRRAPRWAVAALALLLAVAFLSHFSTVSVGIPLVALIAVVLAVAGTAADRRLAGGIAIALVAAVAVSYAAYYSHFTTVYRTTLTRVVSGDGSGEARSMAAPVSVKFARWRHDVSLDFGALAMVAALAGACWLGLRHPRDGLTLVLAGWAATWLFFSALGLVSAIEMRANLAAAPLVVALAAFAIGSLGQSSRAGAALAVLAASALAWNGFAQWMHCLTG
jgi:hypothetical protein